MWANNGTPEWLNAMSPREKETHFDNARKYAGNILEQYNTRKEKVVQEKTEMLHKKEKEKAEMEARQLKTKLELTDRVAKLGGVWNSAEKIENGLKDVKLKTIAHLQIGPKPKRKQTENKRKLKEIKEIEKKQIEALISQLHFHQKVLNTKEKQELFEKSFTKKDGGKHTFSVKELKSNLVEVIQLNDIQENEKCATEANIVFHETDEELVEREKKKHQQTFGRHSSCIVQLDQCVCHRY